MPGSRTTGPRRPRSNRWLPWQQLGLRSRVTATFALGALALSAVMAGLTYFAARQFILHERETAILRQAYVNASFARSSLLGSQTDVTQLLASLDTVPGSLSVLEQHGQWHATSLSVGEEAIPARLRSLVVHGTPATQHFELAGSPQVVVGIPLPAVDAAYFEVFSLDELKRTLQILALALGGAALITTVAGAVIGRWASSRALRPLGVVSKAAETIAGGKLDTRLPEGEDPDLSALSESFNRMADTVVARISREVRFTSDVSHELRSPLTTLATSMGVLEAHKEELPARGRRALDLLTTEVRRFQQMVDDLLEISRADTGSAELLLDEVNAAELARQLALTSGATGARVDIDPSVRDTILVLDKRRIERVVANLVANAQQYAGGVTRLAVEGAPGAVRLVVTDRGPGVPPEERDRIFERFYRGNAARRRGATDGTGLGLSLVAEHVRLHGGRVWVEVSHDGENRFVVELPTANPEDLATDEIDAAETEVLGDATGDASVEDYSPESAIGATAVAPKDERAASRAHR